MRNLLLAAIAIVATAATPAGAADQPTTTLDDSVLILCRDALAMPTEKMHGLVQAIGTRAAKHYDVAQSNDPAADVELQRLVRAGCVMYPDHLAYAIVARSVAAVAEGRAPGQLGQGGTGRPAKLVKPPKP